MGIRHLLGFVWVLHDWLFPHHCLYLHNICYIISYIYISYIIKLAKSHDIQLQIVCVVAACRYN